MVIKARGPLLALLVLFGAGLFGLLFVEHPEPYNLSQPAVAPYQNSRAGESAAPPTPNQHRDKGESNWIDGLFDRPTDALLVLFNGLLVVFTGLLYSATAGLFKETAKLRRIADEQREDLLRSIAAAEKSADAARDAANATSDRVQISREALVTTERAFVFCERIEHHWFADKATENILEWGFYPVWKNGGKTPTKRGFTLVADSKQHQDCPRFSLLSRGSAAPSQ